MIFSGKYRCARVTIVEVSNNKVHFWHPLHDTRMQLPASAITNKGYQATNGGRFYIRKQNSVTVVPLDRVHSDDLEEADRPNAEDDNGQEE